METAVTAAACYYSFNSKEITENVPDCEVAQDMLAVQVISLPSVVKISNHCYATIGKVSTTAPMKLADRREETKTFRDMLLQQQQQNAALMQQQQQLNMALLQFIAQEKNNEKHIAHL